MLKVVSILMIVFGIIAAVFGVIGVVGSGMFVSAAAGTGFAALGTYFLIQGIIAVAGMPEFSTLILNVVGSLLIPGLYIYALKGVSATPSSN